MCSVYREKQRSRAEVAPRTMSVFTGGGVRPQSSKKFLQQVYSVASAVDSVCSSCSSDKFANV